MVCRSEHFAAFQGRSEKEVIIASREIQKRRQEHVRHGAITARRLADFILSVESEEVLLQQRLRDRECTAARKGNAIEPHDTELETIEQGPPRSDADSRHADVATNLQAYAEF